MIQSNSVILKTMSIVIQLLTLSLLFNDSDAARYRLVKVTCSSSNISCTIIECRLKSLSRTNQTLSIGLTILRNLTNPQFRVEYAYKTSDNMWREVFKLEKIPICQFMNRTLRLPYLDNVMDAFEEAFPTFPHRCPLTAGSYYLRNVTNAKFNLIKDTFSNNFGSLQSSGIYKTELSLFSTRDRDIFTLIVQDEVNVSAS